ncbi:hypothetical protein THUN1379_33160 [Paludibacterium sp. THUN1379]|nr:hypothetical protein THUN1379_33160 [Paludibacterium sp. THUN1379]
MTEATEEHQVRTAGDDIDGVDLQQGHAADAGEDIGAGGPAARRVQQSLSAQVQVAGSLSGKVQG